MVALEQDAQALGGSGVHFLDDDELTVEPDVEQPRRVVDERLAAGHARADVPSEGAEDDHSAVRHVLARVAADALDDGGRTGVANGKALARRACEEELAAGRPVENRVPGEAWFAVVVGRRPDHDSATAQALADVIVRLTVENELDARRQEGAEALPCDPFEEIVE